MRRAVAARPVQQPSLGQAGEHYLIRLQAWSGSGTPPSSQIFRSRGMILSKSSSSLTARRRAHQPAPWIKPCPLKSCKCMMCPRRHIKYIGAAAC